ncbi:hypothetical protein FO519_006193 [Halicephalobus sp. NKZ332]|nr:hypothetical protein FO519_006193 [Halicephalobus sp. NKZ332]
MGWRCLFLFLPIWISGSRGEFSLNGCKQALFQKKEGNFYSIGFPKAVEPSQCFVYNFEAPQGKHVEIEFETAEIPSSIGSRANSLKGTIWSPEAPYRTPENSNCSYSFPSLQDHVLKLNVTSLSLLKMDCDENYLMVFQLRPRSVIEKLCSSIDVPFSFSTKNGLLLEFKTGPRKEKRRFPSFSLEYDYVSLDLNSSNPNSSKSSSKNSSNSDFSEIAPGICEEMDHVAAHVLVGSRMSKISDFCGSEIPPPLMSAKNILTLDYVVKSMGGVRKTNPEEDYGFVLEYKFLTDWGNQPKEAIKDTTKSCNFAFNSTVQQVGHFWSPNHPGFYPRNLNCEYTFHGKHGQIVVIHFEYFDIEGFGQCVDATHSDYVLFSNYKTTDRTNRRYCGSMKPPGAIASESNYFRMLFKTNDIFDGTGFYGHYQFVSLHHEKLLYDHLQYGYNKLARPVKNESAPVVVILGLDLQQIIDVDEKAQTITTNVWLRMTWADTYLSWDPNEYGGIKEVRLPIESVWKPDVLLYNSVEQRFDSMWPVNAIVTHNGNITWIPPAIARVLISSLALLSFTLPPDCGEKLNLGVTILVSLSIFMVMVAETMPQTADSLPLIAVYFTSVMFEVGASVVCTVIVLNLHHRNAESYYPMSRFQRRVLLHWLPWLLCMRRPPRVRIPGGYDHHIAFKLPHRRSTDRRRSTATSGALLPLESIEIDNRLLTHPRLYGKTNGLTNADEKKLIYGDNLHMETCSVKKKRKSSFFEDQNENELYLYSRTPERPTKIKARSHRGLLRFEFDPPIRTPSNESPSSCPLFLDSPDQPTKKESGSSEEKPQKAAFSDEQFEVLMTHLRVLTARTQKEELMHEARAEWVFSARVVDRLAGICFTVFLFLCMSTIVWHAPHLIV